MKTRLPISYCPHCGNKLDAATGAFDKNAIPTPGDLTVCINCATVLTFSQELYLTVFENEKLRQLSPEIQVQIQQIRRAIIYRRSQMKGV